MMTRNCETPCLVLDLERMEENFARMRGMLEGTGIALRPHYKSHKCAELARRQIAAGAKGITCAKLGEAEDLVRAGVQDVLIANQIVDPGKILRLAALAGKCRLGVCVDDAENIRALGRAVRAAGTQLHVLTEYDVGMGRCGVRTHGEVLALAKAVLAEENLVYEGIQAYAGQLSHEVDGDIRRAEADRIEADLKRLKAYLEENGVAVNEVSGCSTGTAALKGAQSVYTELQAGSYLFMDASYTRLEPGFVQSLFLHAMVVSTAGGRVVVDAGIKTCGVDQGPPVCVEFPDAQIHLSEEHMDFAMPDAEIRPGMRLTFIPGHCCTTVNLHDRIYLAQSNTIIDCIPVTSRGRAV